MSIGSEDRAFAVLEVGEHRVGWVGDILHVRNEQHISLSGTNRKKVSSSLRKTL